MGHLYQLRTDNLTNDNGETVSTYGITALKIEESIPNLFNDKCKAEEFIAMCNNEKLELIHLNSVVEDMLLCK